VQVKGGSVRAAEATPEIERLFEAARPWEGREDASFLSLLCGKPVTKQGIKSMWARHRRACGINPALHAHDLRRTAASILYAATRDLRVPQQLLGHKSLVSTLSYLAPLAPGEARRYAELLRFEKFHTEVKQ
jgi:integrase